LTESGEFQTPHVVIKIGLEQNQGPLDVKKCLRWLESVPILGKWANVEGVYPSFSTLVILSTPISIWNMLPDNPACNFIGYIMAPSLSSRLTTEELAVNVLSSSKRTVKHLRPTALRTMSVSDANLAATEDITEGRSEGSGYGASANSREFQKRATQVVPYLEPKSGSTKGRWVWMCSKCGSGPYEKNDVLKEPHCSHARKRWMFTDDEDEVRIIKAML
jgi:hypothetical protein